LTSNNSPSHHPRNRPEFPEITGQSFRNPHTCRQGYVWREARASDHVCVSPAMRTQTWEDNSRAAARRARASQGQPIDPGTELQPATD
jgi:hypothetical protein